MADLDGISTAIGRLQEGQVNVIEKLENIHSCLHGNGGVVSRVYALENERSFIKGKAAGIGAIAGATGGAAIAAFWKTIAAKVGISL